LNARINPRVNIIGKPADCASAQRILFGKFAGLDLLIYNRPAKTDLVLYIRKAKKSPGLLLCHVQLLPQTWPRDPLYRSGHARAIWDCNGSWLNIPYKIWLARLN
jgi:hypothetical protein